MSGLVRTVSHGPGVSSLVLQRPEARNALSIALLEELCEALERLAADDAQRVVILRGEGTVFSAGLDLREAADAALVERSAEGIARALKTLQSTPLVSIAAVQGAAYAGGAGLMAACDIVIAAEQTQIGFPEARRGLLPALILDVLRTRVREADLRDLLLTGDPVDARRAQELGLVQRVAPAAGLFEAALRVAASVLAGGPQTIRDTKRLLQDHTPGSAGKWHLRARRGEEAAEGLRAFMAKRPPRWTQEN